MQNTDTVSESKIASTKYRLLSMVYDGLLLMAVLFVAMAIFIPIANAMNIKTGHPAFSVYFLTVCFLFYAGFWTHGGETLGMRTWGIKLIHENGGAISWGQALLRYMTALPGWIVIAVGLSTLVLDQPLNLVKALAWINALPSVLLFAVGLVMLYFDQRPNNWRDRFSHTKIIRIK